jgi:Skp family chaperone for outer membrane proteins
MGRVDWSVVRGHSGECTARMTALMRLQQRVETRLDRLEQQQQQQQPQYQTTNNKHYQQQQEQEQPPLERNHQQSQGSAARLAAAAARVAPAFDRSLAEKGKTFSPRKKLVL